MYYATNQRYTIVSRIVDGFGEICYNLDVDPGVEMCVAYSITEGTYVFDDSIFDSDWPPPISPNPLTGIMSDFPVDPLNGQNRCSVVCHYKYAVNMEDYQKFALITALENGNHYIVCSRGYKIETTFLNWFNEVKTCLGF